MCSAFSFGMRSICRLDSHLFLEGDSMAVSVVDATHGVSRVANFVNRPIGLLLRRILKSNGVDGRLVELKRIRLRRCLLCNM